jgi:uncharacterized membrane protein YkvA (DUF1232 family)
MANYTEAQIEAALRAKSERLSTADILRIVGAKAAVMKMVDEFPDNRARARRQATLLFDLIESCANGKLSVRSDDLKYAAGALIYLGEPLDLVPDDEEDGYADDEAVVSLAIQKSAAQVRLFCETNAVDVSEYLE